VIPVRLDPGSVAGAIHPRPGTRLSRRGRHDTAGEPQHRAAAAPTGDPPLGSAAAGPHVSAHCRPTPAARDVMSARGCLCRRAAPERSASSLGTPPPWLWRLQALMLPLPVVPGGPDPGGRRVAELAGDGCPFHLAPKDTRARVPSGLPTSRQRMMSSSDHGCQPCLFVVSMTERDERALPWRPGSGRRTRHC